MTKSILLLCLFANAFSESVSSSGSVREIRRIEVTPASAPALALIRIDNNLPHYVLVLDFGDATITEVKLQERGGTLGKGLRHPHLAVLAPGAGSGQFIWDPGDQASATVGFEAEVLVTWALPPAEGPSLTVSLAPED